MQPTLLSAASVTNLVCVAGTSDQDHIWIVRNDDRPVLWLRGQQRADGSMDLIPLRPPQAPAQLSPEASQLILSRALPATQQSGVSELRCLIENDRPAMDPSALQEYGFSPAVLLQEWRVAGEPVATPDDGIRRLSLKLCLKELGTALLQNLIGDCLAGSLDLRNLSSPDPQTLLNDWMQHEDAEVFLAGSPTTLCGLAVLSRDPHGETDWNAALEYLGVSQAWRRQGWGGRLLSQVRAAACPAGGPSSGDLVTWCDTENEPAANLYRARGFMPGAQQTIWWRRVTD